MTVRMRQKFSPYDGNTRRLSIWINFVFRFVDSKKISSDFLFLMKKKNSNNLSLCDSFKTKTHMHAFEKKASAFSVNIRHVS